MRIQVRRKGSRRPGRPGVAAVEFALLLPLIMTLLAGIWEVGRIVQVQQILYAAAREGARQASTASLTKGEIEANVRSYIEGAEPNITNFDGFEFTYENITHPDKLEPTEATQLDRLRITIRLPYDNVRWSLLNRITNVTTLTATTDWYSMRDIPVVVDPDLPI